MKARKRVKGM